MIKKIKDNNKYYFYIIILIIIIICLILFLIYYLKKNKDNFTNYNNFEYSDKLNVNDIKEIKKGQKKMSNMLKVFDEICQKHNIRYFLVGGSLLGTILYKGWIPWDGDVDLVVNEHDYDKFKSIIQSELPNTMWFQNYEIDKHYPKTHVVAGKIRDLNSCYIEHTNNGHTQVHNGLQIDILLYNKDNEKIFSDKNEPLMTIDDIYPLKRVPFEDFSVYIMNNSEKYLDKKFGKKWRIILPKEERFPHEGKMDSSKTCPFHYEKYPNLYNNNSSSNNSSSNNSSSNNS